jgi:hypothetical protein
MATLAQVTKLLMGLAAAYAHAPQLTELNYRAYHRFLSDLPYEVLARAAEQVGSESEFFPPASKLRQTAFQLLEWADELPSAYDAWGEIERSFATHGLYRGAPPWSHPLIGQVLKQIGGYANLCRSHNATADRSQFIRAYEEQLKRHRKKTRMLPQVRDSVRRLGHGDTDPAEPPAPDV